MDSQDSNVGADGLTSDQWRKSSNPGANPDLASNYRQQNNDKRNEVNNEKQNEVNDPNKNNQSGDEQESQSGENSGDGGPEKKGQNPQTKTTNSVVVSIANGSAAFGYGVMGDLGVIYDNDGQSSMYLSIGWLMGYGASAGMGFSTPFKKTNINDYSGESSGLLIQIPGKYFKNLSFEGYGNYNKDRNSVLHFGNKYLGGGFNLGIGSVYGYYHSTTLLFPVPSKNFWCKPWHHF
jgi:hypothetical protein